jgi:hypothetical protein
VGWLKGWFGYPPHPSSHNYTLFDLLKGRPVGTLLSSEDHDRVARELEAQEISRPKLDTTTLLLRTAGDDTEPARLLSVESSLLSTGFVAI